MTLVTEARYASLEDMVDILKEQRSRRLDLVIPATQLRFVDGDLMLAGLEPVQKFEDLDGQPMLVEEYDPNGRYRPTEIFEGHVAERFDIPVRYLRRLRKERTDLWDANVNGLIKGRKPLVRQAAFIEPGKERPEPEILREGTPADTRKFFLRTFRGEDSWSGLARALMSSRFAPFDNYDGLIALQTGLVEAGINPAGVQFDRLDLTEKGLYVRASIPELRTKAPELLKNYRNPFDNGAQRAPAAVRGHDIEEWRRIANREGMGYTEEEGGEPVVYAGIGFSNSEVGNGGWNLWPEVVVQVCKNGLKLNAFANSRRHVGGQLEEGVHWQHDTHQVNLELVVKQTRDLITEWTTPAFLQSRVDELEQIAGAPVGEKPQETIQVVAKQVGFTEEQAEGVLAMFLRGGQMTAAGVANAITAFSQTVQNPDTAQALDNQAVKAMQLVAARR